VGILPFGAAIFLVLQSGYGKLGLGGCLRLGLGNLGGGGFLGRGGDEGLKARVEAALVAGDGVLVQDALLDALVERGDGGLELGLCCRHVARNEGFAHQAQAAANAGTVGAVDFRLDDGLTGALERRYVICHLLSNPFGFPVAGVY